MDLETLESFINTSDRNYHICYPHFKKLQIEKFRQYQKQIILNTRRILKPKQLLDITDFDINYKSKLENYIHSNPNDPEIIQLWNRLDKENIQSTYGMKILTKQPPNFIDMDGNETFGGDYTKLNSTYDNVIHYMSPENFKHMNEMRSILLS